MVLQAFSNFDDARDKAGLRQQMLEAVSKDATLDRTGVDSVIHRLQKVRSNGCYLYPTMSMYSGRCGSCS